jgi:hypothetical protein
MRISFQDDMGKEGQSGNLGIGAVFIKCESGFGGGGRSILPKRLK